MEATASIVRITNDETAILWIREFRPHAEVVDGKVVEHHVCNRCGGTGIYSQFHGTCWKCEGKVGRMAWVERTPVKAYARAEKAKDARRKKAAEKRRARAEAALERQRDWCEANGFGRITFDERNAIRKAEREAEQAAKRGVAPAGKTEFVGTVIALRERSAAYGSIIRTTIRMTVLVVTNDGKEWIANGTAPASLLRSDEFGIGAVVRVTATLEPSDEAHFAFAKRPKAEIVTPADEKGRAWSDDA